MSCRLTGAWRTSRAGVACCMPHSSPYSQPMGGKGGLTTPLDPRDDFSSAESRWLMALGSFTSSLSWPHSHLPWLGVCPSSKPHCWAQCNRGFTPTQVPFCQSWSASKLNQSTIIRPWNLLHRCSSWLEFKGSAGKEQKDGRRGLTLVERLEMRQPE